jgi:hypothetical protein
MTTKRFSLSRRTDRPRTVRREPRPQPRIRWYG